jgi:hypothetical protein
MAEKEKTNDTKVIKDQTYCIFIIWAICQQIIQFRLTFKDKGHKSLEYCCQLFSNTFDIRIGTISHSYKYNFLRWIERWYFYSYCAIN